MPEIEIRRRQFGGLLFYVVITTVLVYLGFAALHSEHGLIRLVQVEEQERQLTQTLATLRLERAEIASKTAELSGERPALDLLDERARHVLGLGRPDELLIH